MRDRVEITKRDGITAYMEPLDECCWVLHINKNGKEIESGVWCSNSHVLAINGRCVGFASTPEEVLKQLGSVKKRLWVLKD